MLIVLLFNIYIPTIKTIDIFLLETCTVLCNYIDSIKIQYTIDYPTLLIVSIPLEVFKSSKIDVMMQ